MIKFIIYSIELAICLAVFYSAYWLFLKNETFFKLNRFFLLFSVAVSVLMPLLSIKTVTSPHDNSLLSNYLIQPVEHFEQKFSTIYGYDPLTGEGTNSINAGRSIKSKLSSNSEPENFSDPGQVENSASKFAKENNSEKITDPLSILMTVYVGGVVLFFIRFIANIIWILSYILKYKAQQISMMKVIRSDKTISPFSFLNLIFIGQQHYSESELNKIITHEKVHIQQKHSVDLILFELLLILQWFNPFVWMYKHAIKINHEYLADHGTLDSGVDLNSYQFSLLNQVLRENNFEITSNYNLSIKKRIAMMLKKRSSKLSALRLIIVLPLLLVLCSAFAFSTNDQTDLNPAGRALTPIDTTQIKAKVSKEYLNLIEGEYLSTNQPGKQRRIIFTEVLGTLYGLDNGYTYRLIPVSDGKFTNPDDGATLVFNTLDKNAINLSLFGKINLNKIKFIAGSGTVQNRSMAFTLVKVIVKSGIPAALSYYDLAKDSTNYFLNENEMNLAGYALLQEGKAKEAAAIFKINTEKYPASFNTYDSYAEALLADGDRKGAIENYKKSLQLNPGSKSGIKNLNELGVNTNDLIKTVKVSPEYLRSLEGVYLSTNQPNWMRMIRFSEVGGVLMGMDNGYKYQLIPMGDGKFINPDDGASLVFNTKDPNAISLLLFGTIDLKKIKVSKTPGVGMSEYAGTYIPQRKDSMLTEMEILESNNKLYRYIESAPDNNRTLELEFVTDNIFFYTDRSARSIEFIVNGKKEVTACILRRPDGTYTLTKKK